jgi:hypoxanthine phosphoribosyltransferase
MKKPVTKKRPLKKAVKRVAAPKPSPRAGPAVVTGTDRSRQKSQFRELSWAEFDRLVQSLARKIQASFSPQAVVGVAHGGVFVGGAIASALACEFYPVRISRRSRDKVVRARPRMFGKMPAELKGRRVLVVDDVAASGDTLELARTLATKAGAREVATACLLSRPDGFAPDWTGLPTDEFFVFPWDYEPVAQDARFDIDPNNAGA